MVDGRFGNRFDLLLIVVLDVGLFDVFQFVFDLREYSSMYLKSRGGEIFFWLENYFIFEKNELFFFIDRPYGLDEFY